MSGRGGVGMLFFFKAEDGIRDDLVTGVQTCALPISQHDVRYVAIEIGIGGYQPHYAGDILANRYGDCKDKVTLMRALLHEAGVASDYVLGTTQRRPVRPGFSSVGGFNHVGVTGPRAAGGPPLP